VRLPYIHFVNTREDPMTTTDKTIATILTTLGFEVADDAAFVEDVARLVEANDRDGLIARIAGGASYGEAAETADEILRRAGLRHYVLVETMPVSLRASHEAAGGAGVWPHDGSERVLMHRDDAEVLVETDGGWSRIIRAARPEDDGEYDVIFDASYFTP